MKKYKINYENFWSSFDKESNWFSKLLNKYYNVSYSVEDPDVIMYGPSVFGKFQLPKKPTRLVFYTGENSPVDPRADLNLTFNHGTEHNNRRMPMIVIAPNPDLQLTKEDKKKFCSFVYSNEVDYRNKFCLDLSQYKQVDCGGKCLNNIEIPSVFDMAIPFAHDKRAFMKPYKFSIAYENEPHPGYVTEKIIDAYYSNSIPIYYGSETITKDFNKETLINAHDFNSNEELIEYIKCVDTDEELYNSYLNKPIYSDYWLEIFNDPEETYYRDLADEILGITK